MQGDIQPRQPWEQTPRSISVTCSGKPHTSVIPAATVLCRRQPCVLSKPGLGPGQKEQENTKWVLPERREAQSRYFSSNSNAACCQLGRSLGGPSPVHTGSRPGCEGESPVGDGQGAAACRRGAADPPAPLRPSTRKRKQIAMEQGIFFPLKGQQDHKLVFVYKNVSTEAKE